MIKTLLVKQIKGFLHFYIFDRKTGKRKSVPKLIGLILLTLLCFISLAFAFVGMAALLGGALLNSSETYWMYFAIFSIFGIVIGGLIDSLSSYSMLYLAKDNETLLSMPIKPEQIVLSRVISVYVFALVNLFYVMAPATVFYWINAGFNFKTLIYPLISFFILGIFVTIVTCVFGYLIAFLHKKIKSKIVTTLIATGFLLVFYYLIYFKFDKALENMADQALNIGNTIKDKLFIMSQMGLAHTGDIKSLVIVLVISLALLFVAIKLLSKSFTKIVTSNTGEKKKEVTRKDIKENTVDKTLLHKELKHFTNSVAYMMNCGLGLIFLIAGGVFVLLRKDSVLEVYEMLKMIPGGYDDLFNMIIVVATIAISSLAVISAPSISLEGKSLWILKSLPINPKDIFRSKSNLHFLLNAAPSAFFMVCVGLVINDDSLCSVLGIFIVLVIIKAQGDLGVLLNLRKPNLEWDNETIPVKQSMSVLFSMLIGWAETLVIGALTYLLRKVFNMEIVMSIILALCIAFFLLIRKRLDKKGTELFNEL